MRVRIYQPSRTAMQSGYAKTDSWLLEYETISTRRPEDLMGWVSSEDTLHQVRLKFPSKADAIKFAESKGWEAIVSRERKRKIRPRNYGDNFRYLPPTEL